MPAALLRPSQFPHSTLTLASAVVGRGTGGTRGTIEAGSTSDAEADSSLALTRFPIILATNRRRPASAAAPRRARRGELLPPARRALHGHPEGDHARLPRGDE